MAFTMTRKHSPQRPLHVLFLHLDWGIGGAEQLMCQLADASLALGHRIDLLTTHCEPSHCFDSLSPDGGHLYPFLHVKGRWIPHDIAGKARALCSTLRLLWLAYQAARRAPPDLIVTDVLPTPLPLLRDAPLLFYCHFPDQLLKQSQTTSAWTRLYRSLTNALEAHTMSYSDVCVVNSHFTQRVVRETFAIATDLPVLYPALDTASLETESSDNDDASNKELLFVSLNRYERKKDLALFLRAVAQLRCQDRMPKLVVAGGYDPINTENVEYHNELQALAQQLGVSVQFERSISGARRLQLLQTATAVVYTPSNEHFGIVPLEAMYVGTPVVACASGGPLETVLDGTTGYLCEPTPEAFAKALQSFVDDPDKARTMGQAARDHVRDRFGPERLQSEWRALCAQAVERGRSRRSRILSIRTVLLACESLVVLLLCFGLARLLSLVVWDSNEWFWEHMRVWLLRHKGDNEL